MSLKEYSDQLKREEAMEIGSRIGKLIGKEIEMAVVKKEKAFEIAETLIARGIPTSDIAKLTSLKKSIIISLRELLE
jgi:fumarylacetoacetate (FAA) hydrolase family protein